MIDAKFIDSFLHIPKTGGSTLRAIMARQYGVDSIVYCEPTSPKWPQGETVLSFMKSKMASQRVALVTGHYPLGVHEYVRKPVRYFSMMRDPLDRELSNYYYAFAYPNHFLGEVIRSGQLSFQNFLERHNGNQAAFQAYILTGSYPHRNSTLAAAGFNMDRSLAAIGVAERFDESLLFFAKQLGWQPPLYVKRNVTRLDKTRQAEREAILTAARSSSCDLLSLDYSLYGVANILLNDFIEQAGKDFKEAMENLSELQNDLQRTENSDVFNEYAFDDAAPLPFGADKYRDSVPFRQIRRFLEEPLKLRQPIHNFVGYVERTQPGTIFGWALDLWCEVPVSVTAWYDGHKVGQAECRNLREDLLKVGYSSCQAGFRLDVGPDVPIEKVLVSFGESPILLRFHKG